MCRASVRFHRLKHIAHHSLAHHLHRDSPSHRTIRISPAQTLHHIVWPSVLPHHSHHIILRLSCVRQNLSFYPSHYLRFVPSFSRSDSVSHCLALRFAPSFASHYSHHSHYIRIASTTSRIIILSLRLCLTLSGSVSPHPSHYIILRLTCARSQSLVHHSRFCTLPSAGSFLQ